MRSFDELTYLKKVYRFRQVAKVVLPAYGIAGAQFKLLRIAGNAVFRVFASDPSTDATTNDIYQPGQYLLRIHDDSEQPAGAIRLEMEWLAAIYRDAELPVPQPVPALDGNLMLEVSIPAIGEIRNCTLLRWVKGRYVSKRIQPCHFKAQGQMMAQLHNHAAGWQPPKNLTKRRFNWEGMFADDAGAGLPNSQAWALLRPQYRGPFETISGKVKQVMDEFGQGSELYGLIHGDCGVDANVLFWKGEARIIDFDGSGFGYYLYDLALALEHCWDDPAYPEYRDALLKGYTEFRPLPEYQRQNLDLFLAAFYVYMSLWTAALTQTRPDSPGNPHRLRRWQERGLRYIKTHISEI